MTTLAFVLGLIVGAAMMALWYRPRRSDSADDALGDKS